MTEQVEEVQDPAALLASYNALKDDVKVLRAQLTETQKAREDAEKALEDNTPDEWRNRALTAETKVALNSQGIKDADRLVKYVGTEGLDFDEEGKLTGLDDRLKQLKTDLPEIFDAKRRAGGTADIFADSPPNAQADPFREAIHQSLSA